MPEIVYNQAVAASKSFPGTLTRVYLVAGADDALKREVLHRLYEAGLDPSFADFDRETIDLGAGGDGMEDGDPVVKILSAANSSPFGSPRRVVTVLSIQRLSKERQEALAAGMPKLGELTLLILVADAQEYEAGRPKGKSVENALKKAIVSTGTIVMCEAAEAKDLRQRAAALFEERGKRCAPEVLEILMARAHSASSSSSGGDVNTLINEAEKLIAYVGDRGDVTAHDARQLIPQIADENIFALMDAVGARETTAAIRQCEALLESGEKADGVAARTFVMLHRHFRLMMLAKHLADNNAVGRGALPGEIKEILSGEMVGFAVGQSYRVSQYARQATRYTWAELTMGMNRILLSDLMMKGIARGESSIVIAPTTDDPATNLRMLVVALCRIGKENQPGVRAANTKSPPAVRQRG